ncbi:hypothetical protein LMANV2_90034 [Leptospira interrogans serovar Manilae]|uniref:Uncharacterized protein n=1 Tax=Leptospira interrogans serovar Manilae TaxID=214675 RepID=A0AAQ1P3X8_LEPIR|nr:hypothetical protein LMANV2_90034 [Leptospira interrogans serovar Manilae]
MHVKSVNDFCENTTRRLKGNFLRRAAPILGFYYILKIHFVLISTKQVSLKT